MRTLKVILAVSLPLLWCCLLGCHQSVDVEKRLGLNYTPPTLPVGLEQYFTPSPNQKAMEELRDGEIKIDMHQYYREYHQEGWDAAISEYKRKENREYESESDVRMSIQAMQIGCEAYWIGYDDAYCQIKVATNKP